MYEPEHELTDYERLTNHQPEPLPTSAVGGAVSMGRSVLRDSGTTGFLAVVLAIFLMVVVWFRFNTVESNQAKILDAMGSANVAMSKFAAQHAEIENQRSVLLQSQINLLRLLCQNSAKNEFQQAKCAAE